MSISENHAKQNEQIKTRIYNQTNSRNDKRLQMIYDRYHTGKSLIIDDLKYLCGKDPEGCNKFVNNIIGTQDKNQITNRATNMDELNYAMNQDEVNLKQQAVIDSQTTSDFITDDKRNGYKILSSIKQAISSMDDTEKLDMLKNLFNQLEVKKINQEMSSWNDSFIDRMAIYSYNKDAREKEINTLI